jgi:hypothetical protein
VAQWGTRLPLINIFILLDKSESVIIFGRTLGLVLLHEQRPHKMTLSMIHPENMMLLPQFTISF